ncbi:uncharacterized protein YlaN (UPF0358 family) [Anaerosolibacter carboniphilus]|uniref:Uncharacterized protein YlaN (UPF0358 family) n=1 Tax=Anaerosolibacter carboniphilus TaxID=1417629 RepID=A0A841KLY5_9FIRM|nr:YckD family protein [Anaerosolibacter carboniphilus]MBB6214436.1 uncharacterized protein YlaN (UPF0358 family) [Anaerosolibacter carboniphilus]
MSNFRTVLVASLLVFVFAVSFGVLSIQPVEGLTLDAEKATVQLTEAQKKELATLQKEILMKRKEVISKYVEYGVMTEEKGKKIISRLEKHYEKLEKNGFVPKWDKSKKKRCH